MRSQDQSVVVTSLLALVRHELPSFIDLGSNNQDSKYGLILDVDNYRQLQHIARLSDTLQNQKLRKH